MEKKSKKHRCDSDRDDRETASQDKKRKKKFRSERSSTADSIIFIDTCSLAHAISTPFSTVKTQTPVKPVRKRQSSSPPKFQISRIIKEPFKQFKQNLQDAVTEERNRQKQR